MLCKPEDAKNFKCCMMEKACEGDKCMAWRTHYEEDPFAPQRFGFRNYPLPRPYVESDKGYCGMTDRG